MKPATLDIRFVLTRRIEKVEDIDMAIEAILEHLEKLEIAAHNLEELRAQMRRNLDG
jgi:hypothetical protein